MAIVEANVGLLVGMPNTIAHNHSKTDNDSLSNTQSTEKFCLKGENTWIPNIREKEPVERVKNDSYLHIL